MGELVNKVSVGLRITGFGRSNAMASMSVFSGKKCECLSSVSAVVAVNSLVIEAIVLSVLSAAMISESGPSLSLPLSLLLLHHRY